MGLGHDILMVAIGIVIGTVIGFFLCKLYMQKYLKKNPPISEKTIEAMMTSMGRKPSQKQVKQVMQQMKRSK